VLTAAFLSFAYSTHTTKGYSLLHAPICRVVIAVLPFFKLLASSLFLSFLYQRSPVGLHRNPETLL
jgi:hypothetical protein